MTDKIRETSDAETTETSETADANQPRPVHLTKIADANQPRPVHLTKTADAAEAIPEDPTEQEDGESVTDAPPDDESPKRAKRELRNWSRGPRRVKAVSVALVLLLLTSAGVATWLFFERYQPNRKTDATVADAVVKAASEGTVALLSYSPDSLDKDFATAKAHLSGDFLSYYNQFTEQIVAPAAKQKSLKTTAHVIRAAVSELHPDSAVVLVYVDQSTTSKDKPEPAMSASSVLVSMIRTNGTWLITKFDPV